MASAYINAHACAATRDTKGYSNSQPGGRDRRHRLTNGLTKVKYVVMRAAFGDGNMDHCTVQLCDGCVRILFSFALWLLPRPSSDRRVDRQSRL